MNNNEFIQRDFFDKNESLYQSQVIINLPTSQQLELECLEKVFLSPCKIIDFGCGSGRISLYFLRHGFDVIGVDISTRSLQKLEDLYQKFKSASWGRLETMTTLPQTQVDGIVGADILHHIDMSTYLPQFFSTLMDGGHVVFSEPNGLHPTWYGYLWIKRIPWQVEKGLLKCTPGNIRRKLADTDFHHIKITPHGMLPTFLFNHWNSLCRFNAFNLSKLPVINRFSFRLIVEAQK